MVATVAPRARGSGQVVDGAAAERGVPVGGSAGADDELGPPPTPFERVPLPATDGRRGRPAARTVVALLGLAGAGVGLVAGLILTGVLTLPLRGAGDPDALNDLSMPGEASSERDAALVVLLEDIVASEGIMLAFNDEITERLQEAQDEAVALEAVAAAAGEAVDDLVTARPVLVGRSGAGELDEVRDAYLPHLDAWIEYLRALSVQPDLLFSEAPQQPYLLLINATAADFSVALEALLATGPAPAVAELAERILDDGFRGFGADAQL